MRSVLNRISVGGMKPENVNDDESSRIQVDSRANQEAQAGDLEAGSDLEESTGTVIMVDQSRSSNEEYSENSKCLVFLGAQAFEGRATECHREFFFPNAHDFKNATINSGLDVFIHPGVQFIYVPIFTI